MFTKIEYTVLVNPTTKKGTNNMNMHDMKKWYDKNKYDILERLESEMTLAVCDVVLNELLDIPTSENHEDVLKKWVKKQDRDTIHNLVEKMNYIYGSAFDIWKVYTEKEDYVDNDGFVSTICNDYVNSYKNDVFNYKATLAYTAHWNMMYKLFDYTCNMSNVTIHFVPTKTNYVMDCFHGMNLLIFSHFMATYNKGRVNWFSFEEDILNKVKEECDLTFFFDSHSNKFKFKIKK